MTQRRLCATSYGWGEFQDGALRRSVGRVWPTRMAKKHHHYRYARYPHRAPLPHFKAPLSDKDTKHMLPPGGTPGRPRLFWKHVTQTLSKDGNRSTSFTTAKWLYFIDGYKTVLWSMRLHRYTYVSKKVRLKLEARRKSSANMGLYDCTAGCHYVHWGIVLRPTIGTQQPLI